MHPAFLGAQYPYSVTPPSLAATAVSFPVPSMAPITVHPYHTEPGLPLPTSVACELWGQGTGEWRGGPLGRGDGGGTLSVPLWAVSCSYGFCPSHSEQCPSSIHVSSHPGCLVACPDYAAQPSGERGVSTTRGGDTQSACQPTQPTPPARCLPCW